MSRDSTNAVCDWLQQLCLMNIPSWAAK